MTKDRITGEKKTTTFIYAYDTHTRESDEYLKEVRIWGLRAILIKGDTSGRNAKTKEKGFGLLGAVNCGRVNVWGKIMELRVILVRFLSPVVFFLLAQEKGRGTHSFTAEKCRSCFLAKEGGQRAL